MAADGTPRVSVNVPCFRQLPLARLTVEAFRRQSLTDFALTLFDDGASDEYRHYVESLDDPRVRYERNQVRLGAMRNMGACIAAGTGTYSVAFHEDDLPDPEFLASALEILEAQPDCGFVACELREFDGDIQADVAAPRALVYERFDDGAAFLRLIFRGVEPMFGSIVYRRAAINGRAVEHERFGTLADRPFLLSILAEWSGAVIRRPALAWYRTHRDDDDRHASLTSDHVLRLFERYRAAFPDRWSAEDAASFHRYSGYWLMTLYHKAPVSERAPVRQFVRRAVRNGLYDVRFAAGYGRKRLLREILFASAHAAR